MRLGFLGDRQLGLGLSGGRQLGLGWRGVACPDVLKDPGSRVSLPVAHYSDTNLGDYSPRVRQRAPAKKEEKSSPRLSTKSAVRLFSSSTLRLKAVARRLSSSYNSQ